MTPFLSPIRLALVLALAAAVVAGFVLVPAGASLPIHWNIEGVADAFAPREVALLIPVAMVALVWLVFALVGRFGRRAELDAGRHVTSAAITLVIALALVIELATLAIGLGQDVDIVRLIAIAFAVLLVVLGNALPKSQPNSYAGIRIPSTLRDPANWQATHRLGGVLAIAGGLVLLVAAFAIPTGQLIYWLLACTFIPMLVAILYSIGRGGRNARSS